MDGGRNPWKDDPWGQRPFGGHLLTQLYVAWLAACEARRECRRRSGGAPRATFSAAPCEALAAKDAADEREEQEEKADCGEDQQPLGSELERPDAHRHRFGCERSRRRSRRIGER